MIEQPLILQRTILPLGDGTFYSDVVVLEFVDTATGHKQIFYCDPNNLFDIVKSGITSMSQVKPGDYNTMTEEQIALKKRAVAFMRAAIKAMLIGGGDMLLTLFLGKDHERPPKAKRGDNFDLIDWYMDMFTKIGLSYMMKSDTVLRGTLTYDTKDMHVYTVHEVTTRPVTQEDDIRDTSSTE